MVTKTDQVLLRRLDIARLLVNGADWPEIAAWLRSEGIEVSTGQARVYWWRHYRDVPAAVIVAETEAAIATEQRALMEAQLADAMNSMGALQLQAAAAQAEADELRRQFAELRGASDQARVEATDLKCLLERAHNERDGWRRRHGEVLADLDQQKKKLAEEQEVLKQWMDFCRALVADHTAKNTAGVNARIINLREWFAERRG